MSWEDDDYTPEVQATAVAVVEDKAVAEAEAALAKAALAAAAAPAEKARKEAEKEAQAAAARKLALEQAPLSDPAAERERIRRLELESDLAAGAAAFGSPTVKGGVARDLESLVTALPLVDTESFKKLGKLIAAQIAKAAGSSKSGQELAVQFYRELLSASVDHFSVDNLRLIEDAAGAARSTRLKKDKEETLKGKKGKAAAKKGMKKMHVGGDMDDYEEEAYEEVDAKGNSGNVAASVAALGLGDSAAAAGGGGAAEGDPKFVRTQFQAESDFM